ncbi:MAG TPA: trypsin-like peptidase domain-containing protein [Candidatus Dormibacteraeota bacterium]|nr:trypsin-like peptidase domain-containing protein [Candidatus Dormibacteraeota bacterium]
MDAPRRRPGPGWRGGLALLLAGLLVGGLVVFAALRDRGGSSIAEVQVNGSPAKAPTVAAMEVANQLGPAVGTIVATLQSSNALGSGFVMARDSSVSYLVTNNHVVTGASALHVVMPDGHQFKATLVGTDPLDDIAVVSVPSTTLPQATFGTSAKLSVGEGVIAIGSPLGDQGSVTVGVISALHRTITASGEAGSSSETLEDVLQTDASINPGNSGGPLADTAGSVVGVNVATAGNATSIGYSIPADLARYVAETLIAHQKVQHPFLGVDYLTSIAAIENGTPFDGPGVYIKSVSSGTPAAKAGLAAGDVLVAIDGVAIDNGVTLGGLIQPHHVGDTIVCTVHRAGKAITLNATLVERPGA